MGYSETSRLYKMNEQLQKLLGSELGGTVYRVFRTANDVEHNQGELGPWLEIYSGMNLYLPPRQDPDLMNRSWPDILFDKNYLALIIPQWVIFASERLQIARIIERRYVVKNPNNPNSGLALLLEPQANEKLKARCTYIAGENGKVGSWQFGDKFDDAGTAVALWAKTLSQAMCLRYFDSGGLFIDHDSDLSTHQAAALIREIAKI